MPFVPASYACSMYRQATHACSHVVYPMAKDLMMMLMMIMMMMMIMIMIMIMMIMMMMT